MTHTAIKGLALDYSVFKVVSVVVVVVVVTVVAVVCAIKHTPLCALKKSEKKWKMGGGGKEGEKVWSGSVEEGLSEDDEGKEKAKKVKKGGGGGGGGDGEQQKQKQIKKHSSTCVW